jgi:hypothetical protein
MKNMKNIILTIVLISICFTGLGQRKLLAGTTRYTPKMENQVTKEDSLSDEYGKEYFEREFQGPEEDTAFLNQDMREREALKKGKITDPEREINTFDYEKIFFTDMKDFEKAEQEEKAKAIKEKEAIKPKK